MLSRCIQLRASRHALRTPLYTAISAHRRHLHSWRSPRTLSKLATLSVGAAIVGGTTMWLTSSPTPAPAETQEPLAGIHQTPPPPQAPADKKTAIGHVISWISTTTQHVYHVYVRDGLFEILLTVVRCGQLLVYFTPVVVAWPAVWFQPDAGAVRRWWYRVLRRQMSLAGPTFVKLAQWAASRTDLFSQQLCTELGQLHDANTEHAAEHSRRQVCRLFGVDTLDQVFDQFDDQALGAGAVAQVHYARFRADQLPPGTPATAANKEVAIKVLHPGVDRLIRRDLRIMHWGAVVIGWLPGMSWLSLAEEVRVFGTMMLAQLDLRVEASNLRKFRANFSARPATRFPQPLGVCSETVLIESYEDGVPLRAFLDASTPYDRALGAHGLEAFLHMLIYDNFVHADLHPGNILVALRSPASAVSPLDRFVEEFYEKSPFRREYWLAERDPLPTSAQAHRRVREIMQKGDMKGVEEYVGALYANGFSAELVMLDCGLATSLDATNRRNFLDLFQAVCMFDGKRAGTLMIERCRTPSLVVSPDVFVLRIQDIILKVRKVSLQLSKLTFGDIFAPVLFAVRSHHVKLEPDFINIIMAMFVLEGIGRRLDPDSDILKVALPMLRTWLKAEAKSDLAWPKGKEIRMVSNWHLLRVWLYVEVREYIDRIRDWGNDDYEFFGRFAPFVTADSSIS